MNTVGGVILSVITLLVVGQASATPLYTLELAGDEALLAPATATPLPYVHTFIAQAPTGNPSAPVSSHSTGASYGDIVPADDVSIGAMSFAAGWSQPTAVAPEPSGLAALAIVMVTLGVGGVMRLAQEVGTVVTQCARYRIELGGVRRWWTAHLRQGR